LSILAAVAAIPKYLIEIGVIMDAEFSNNYWGNVRY
jgi:hypothetical protein